MDSHEFSKSTGNGKFFVKRIKLLEAALGRKTLENEILKEAVDFAKSKKWIARSPLLPGDDQ